MAGGGAALNSPPVYEIFNSSPDIVNNNDIVGNNNNDIVIDLNNENIDDTDPNPDPDPDINLNNLNLKVNMQIINSIINSNTIYRIKRFKIKKNGCSTLSKIKDTLILSIFPQIPYNTNIDNNSFYIPDTDINNFNNYFQKIYDVSGLKKLIPLNSSYINKYNSTTYVFNILTNITNINTLIGYSVLNSFGVYIGKIIKIKSEIGKKRNKNNNIFKSCLVITLNTNWVIDDIYYLINIIDPPSIASLNSSSIIYNLSLKPKLTGIETLYPLLDKPTCDENLYRTVQYNIINSLISSFNIKNIPIRNNAITMCFSNICPSNTKLTKGNLIFNDSILTNGYICDVSNVNINKNNEKMCINNTILYNTLLDEPRCGILPDIMYI